MDPFSLTFVLIVSVNLFLVAAFPIFVRSHFKWREKYFIETGFSRPHPRSFAMYAIILGSGFVFLVGTFFVDSAHVDPTIRETMRDLETIAEFQFEHKKARGRFAGEADPRTAFSELGWPATERKRLSAYYCGNDKVLPSEELMKLIRLDPPTEAWPFALKPAVSADGFTCIAYGNIDEDPNPDVWMINDDNVVLRLIDDSKNTANVDIYNLSTFDAGKEYARVMGGVERKNRKFTVLITAVFVFYAAASIASVIALSVYSRRYNKLIEKGKIG